MKIPGEAIQGLRSTPMGANMFVSICSIENILKAKLRQENFEDPRDCNTVNIANIVNITRP